MRAITYFFTGTIIGPDEVLVFEVELLDIQEVEQRDDLESYRFEDLDLDNDGLLSRDEVQFRPTYHAVNYINQLYIKPKKIARL